jgi:IS1 family transposase
MKPKTSEVNTELKLFCPRRNCPFHQLLDNKITKDGIYRTKNDPIPRQMLYCWGGEHRFSETGYSDLFGKHGSFKKYEQVAKLTCAGVSSQVIADVLELDVRTVETWQRCISKKSNAFHSVICTLLTLNLLFIQMDELWSYLGKKQKQLWVFIGFEVESRFWINFELGSRTTHTATKLVSGIKKYMTLFSANKPLKITTDKLAAYKNALQSVLKEQPYVYLQIVKRRIHKRLVTVKKCFVKGTTADFTGKSQNTSYIERFNLTLRQRVSYLQRKSLGYCKKRSNFNVILWINLFDYNYRTVHKSLRLAVVQPGSQRFQKKWQHRTPAMAMGLTNQVLSWRFLFLVPISANLLKN